MRPSPHGGRLPGRQARITVLSGAQPTLPASGLCGARLAGRGRKAKQEQDRVLGAWADLLPAARAVFLPAFQQRSTGQAAGAV